MPAELMPDTLSCHLAADSNQLLNALAFTVLLEPFDFLIAARAGGWNPDSMKVSLQRHEIQTGSHLCKAASLRSRRSLQNRMETERSGAWLVDSVAAALTD